MKKIFRWTVGNVSKIGLDILDKSIEQAKKNLSKFDFAFYVCLNSDIKEAEKICLKHRVEIIKTSWDSFPIPKNSIEDKVPRGRRGSFWKLCPPRLFLDSYEIISDNDVVFQKCPIEIEEFLNSNKTLVLEENIFSFGKYTKFISEPYNSGLYGLPPEYDFAKKIVDKWSETEFMNPLFSRDEQGLIILTLISTDYIKIPKEKCNFVFDQGEFESAEYEKIFENGFESQVVKKIKFKKSKLENDIIHFLGANRQEYHSYWNKYKLKLI